MAATTWPTPNWPQDVPHEISGYEIKERLKPIMWNEVGEKVYLPAWESHTKMYRNILCGVTPKKFPDLSRDLNKFSNRIEEISGEFLDPEERFETASTVLCSALAATLKKKGRKYFRSKKTRKKKSL